MQPTAVSAKYPIRSIMGLVGLLVVAGMAIWTIINRQFVIDQFIVWQYQPSSSVSSIAERAALSQTGKFLFYASKPEINDRTAFNKNCEQLVEKSVVLGCYADRRIFIFDISDARLDGIREVTAAHEMLHAAYDRLSLSRRSQIDGLIEAQAKSITDPKLADRIKLYEQTEPGERLNELHSIIGTEISTLSPELEEYYGQYFVDRSQVVALSNRYEKVFRELEDRQQTLIVELNTLASSIDAQSIDYEKSLGILQTDIDRFNARAEAGSFASSAAFTAERSRLVARQTTLQVQHDAIMAKITEYNDKKTQLDQLNTTAEGLHHSINSALTETPRIN